MRLDLGFFGAAVFGGGCPVCGRDDPPGLRTVDTPCEDCRESLCPAPILAVPDGLDACRALTCYAGVGRDLVTALKFTNRRSAVPWVAGRLGVVLEGDAIDVVTWAPTAAVRRRHRGFDQAEVLARQLGRVLDRPVERCLVRLPGPPQTGRHRCERIHGPRFDVRRGIGRAVGGHRVGLVDDVVTTGATLTRAAGVLRANGATGVIGVAIARTPRSW